MNRVKNYNALIIISFIFLLTRSSVMPGEEAKAEAVSVATLEPKIVDAVGEKSDVSKEQTPVFTIPAEKAAKNDKDIDVGVLSEDAHVLPHYAYLGQFLKPWEYIKEDKIIEINFENAQLITLIKYFEKEYGLTFILDDVIEPKPEGGINPASIRFSFKTEKPLNTKQAWEIFVAFLDMAGLMIIPGPAERIYQITSNRRDSQLSTNKEPIPTFIGVDPLLLPSSDIKIRYVYFIQNASGDTIKDVVDKLRSPIASDSILVKELNALIMIDRASSIQTILAILNELDKPILPETLIILKLKKTDATKIKAIYDSLVKEESSLLPRIGWGKKQTSVGFFTESVRVVADGRTNSLIILGPRANVKRVEDFIQKELDRDVELPYSPLHVYMLKFIDAATTARILTDLKSGFQSGDSDAIKFGGVVGGTKYLKPTVTITAETSSNSLVINADYDDYLQIYELLEKIDVEQPQVATHILILNVDFGQDKELGIQFRNNTNSDCLNNKNNINFQTSGLPLKTDVFGPIVQDTTVASGAGRLLGDLINLASGNVVGSTLLTLGADSHGVWGLFKVLQSTTNASVIAKPFLVTTNKYNAQIVVGEIRRVQTSKIVGENDQLTFGDLSAGLTINLTPQISPDGLITLAINAEVSNFTEKSGDAVDAGNQNKKIINTSVTVADNQVLALGGLVIDRNVETEYRVPILGSIPIVGWFFRNKAQTKSQTSLLVLIASKIIKPRAEGVINEFTRGRIDATQGLYDKMNGDNQSLDPVDRFFFEGASTETSDQVRSFGSPGRSFKKGTQVLPQSRDEARTARLQRTTKQPKAKKPDKVALPPLQSQAKVFINGKPQANTIGAASSVAPKADPVKKDVLAAQELTRTDQGIAADLPKPTEEKAIMPENGVRRSRSLHEFIPPTAGGAAPHGT